MTEKHIGTLHGCEIYETATGRDFNSLAEILKHIDAHRLIGLLISPATTKQFDSMPKIAKDQE